MKLLLVSLSAIAALALTGCGSEDEPQPESESRLTKAEFIQQADAICKASNEEIEAAGSEFANPQQPTEAEVEKAVKGVLIPEVRSQLEGLRELEPPKEDEDEVDAMLDALEADIEKAEKDYRFALSGTAFQEANRAATEYGLTECGDA